MDQAIAPSGSTTPKLEPMTRLSVSTSETFEMSMSKFGAEVPLAVSKQKLMLLMLGKTCCAMLTHPMYSKRDHIREVLLDQTHLHDCKMNIMRRSKARYQAEIPSRCHHLGSLLEGTTDTGSVVEMSILHGSYAGHICRECHASVCEPVPESGKL